MLLLRPALSVSTCAFDRASRLKILGGSLYTKLQQQNADLEQCDARHLGQVRHTRCIGVL